jgi:hypothetical protein
MDRGSCFSMATQSGVGLLLVAEMHSYNYYCYQQAVESYQPWDHS